MLCLSGSSYDMGLQHGSLLRERLRELVANYLHRSLLCELGIAQQSLLTYVRLLDQDLPADLRQEMQGIADGAGLSYQDVLLLNVVPDLLGLTQALPSLELSLTLLGGPRASDDLSQTALYSSQRSAGLSCAHFAAWGEATADGGLLVAHNIESGQPDLLTRYPVLVVRRPLQGNASVSLGMIGMVGVWAGMNEEKITATLSGSPSADPMSNGQPLPFILRHIMDHAGDLEQAIHLLLGTSRLCGGNLILGDGKAPHAVAVELSAHQHSVLRVDEGSQLVARTNHFLDLALASAQQEVLSDDTQRISLARLAAVQSLLELNYGWIDPAKALSILKEDQQTEWRPAAASGTEGPPAAMGILFDAQRMAVHVTQGDTTQSFALGDVAASRPAGTNGVPAALPASCLLSR